MPSCLSYINGFTGTKCLLVNEASSSKTAFFSFNSTFGVNTIMDGTKAKPKYTLQGQEIDKYAIKGDVIGYYNVIRGNNAVINKHIVDSPCTIFYWALLATGGMRTLRENQGFDVENQFYSGLQHMFDANPTTCVGNVCKKVVLVRSETITGKEEGLYAWFTLQATYNVNCHAVIDLGGETGQFANQTYQFSDDLGKGHAVSILSTSNYTDFDACFNNPPFVGSNVNLYDGQLCRKVIYSYVSNEFGSVLPAVNYDQYCSFFTISNFYVYFNDICNTYRPEVNGKINPSTYAQIEDLCNTKNQGLLFSMGINGYQNITDEVCTFWNNNWSGQKADFARDACFSGNYNYQILRAFGLQDEHQVQIGFIGDEVDIDPSDWAPGAANDSVAACNIAPAPTPNPLTYYDNEISGLKTMFYSLAAVTATVVTGLLIYTCLRHGRMNAMKAAVFSKLTKIDGVIRDLAASHSHLGIKVDDLGGNVEHTFEALGSRIDGVESRLSALEAGSQHLLGAEQHHYGTHH